MLLTPCTNYVYICMYVSVSVGIQPSKFVYVIPVCSSGRFVCMCTKNLPVYVYGSRLSMVCVCMAYVCVCVHTSPNNACAHCCLLALPVRYRESMPLFVSVMGTNPTLAWRMS